MGLIKVCNFQYDYGDSMIISMEVLIAVAGQICTQNG